jgi:hypothetical protein
MNFLRPYKSDIKQIESLVKIGVSHNDIALVLQVTPATLEKWKLKNNVVNDLLRSKPRPEYTLSHPDFADKIEEAFTCGGKRFYRFKDEFRMSTGRYSYYYAALQEFNLNISRAKLIEFVDAFELILNGGKKGQGITIGKLWELIINLKTRIHKLAFEPKLARDLAAIAYFDETEDITTYNSEYGKEKIRLWEEHNVHDFFFEKPIGELLGVSSTSIQPLEDYLKTAEQILTDLNYGLLKVSEES